jgi:hypothetical protein
MTRSKRTMSRGPAVAETAVTTSRGSLDGGKLYEQRARNALPILCRQAKANEPIYYSDLAAELGMPNERNLNYVLGLIGNELRKLSVVWHSEIPPLQAIVQNRATDAPGEGFAFFADDPEEFKRASRSQRRVMVKILLQRVWLYPDWDRVLDHFGLEPAASRWVGRAPDHPLPARGGSGESLEHVRLKEFVAAHPEAVGLPASLPQGRVEYCFASGDSVDVLFNSRPEWVAVEVKSRVSDDQDLARGVHQCVKYRALMEAEQKVRQLPLSCRVLLATERPLSPELLVLRNTLGIEARVVPFEADE